jgi:hypothetical protein
MRLVHTLLCSLIVVSGCGAQMSKDAAYMAPAEEFVGNAEEAAVPADAEVRPDVAQVPRKIIYEAEVRLVVRDFAEVETELPKLVKEHGGYLANVSIDRATGQQRYGTWQARIPTDQFEQFLSAASKLGVPESRSQTAQDVTEEFFDLEAQIANKKRLEERIIKLVEESKGKLKEIIEVERELARVRSEIEQKEGRLRYLTNRTALTTVTITVREQQDYVPPEAPTFLTRIQQAWSDSQLSVTQFAQNTTVAAIYALPWLAMLLVVLVPLIWWIRRRRARRLAKKQSA